MSPCFLNSVKFLLLFRIEYFNGNNDKTILERPLPRDVFSYSRYLIECKPLRNNWNSDKGDVFCLFVSFFNVFLMIRGMPISQMGTFSFTIRDKFHSTTRKKVLRKRPVNLRYQCKKEYTSLIYHLVNRYQQNHSHISCGHNLANECLRYSNLAFWFLQLKMCLPHLRTFPYKNFIFYALQHILFYQLTTLEMRYDFDRRVKVINLKRQYDSLKHMQICYKKNIACIGTISSTLVEFHILSLLSLLSPVFSTLWHHCVSLFALSFFSVAIIKRLFLFHELYHLKRNVEYKTCDSLLPCSKSSWYLYISWLCI